MLRSEQSNKSGERESCWARDESACLRVELADGSWLILPYGQMQSAWLRPGSPTETLELRFASYRVQMAGGNLSKLAIAFQKQAVDFVRISTKSERMGREGPTWIASINVEAIDRNEGAELSAPE